VRVADDVAGDDRILGVLQDPLELGARGLGERAVDLVDGRLAGGDERQVHQRARRDGGADRKAVQAAVELGQHEADGLRRARRRRHEVHRGGPRAAQILVRPVLEVLVGRVGMDRRHQAVLDADRLVDGLGERSEAVRRAGGVGDDVVRVLVVRVEVHAEHDGDVLAAGGRGDDDLLRAGFEVLGGVVALREEAGRLQDHVDAEITPSEVRRVTLGLDEDLLAVHDEAVVGQLDRARVRAQDRVVAQQVGQRLVVGQVVDGDPFDVRLRRLGGTKHVAADAAEAVDSNTYGHAVVTVLPKFSETRLCAKSGLRALDRVRNPTGTARAVRVWLMRARPRLMATRRGRLAPGALR
jgi:hypothetical protein